jgi:hypothetical protein
MRGASERGSTMFGGVPRRRGLSAMLTVGLWLSICGAFAAEIFPVRSAGERMYELEAARDRFVRAAASREAVATRDAERPATREAERPASVGLAPPAAGVQARVARPALAGPAFATAGTAAARAPAASCSCE